MSTRRPYRLAALTLGMLAAAPAAAEKLHVSYLWHLEQPIYWPDQRSEGPYRYERAWASIVQTDGGAAHPENNLRSIFSVPDRVAAYQFRPRDTISAISWLPEAGAQVSFSGGLIENIDSFADAGGQLGYGTNWYQSFREARGWTTNSGPAVPRCDMVRFAHHHPLLPLVDDAVIRKELALHAEVYDDAWGTAVPMSRGFFPSEMAFSTRIIPALADAGIEWCLVSSEKISRACADYPVVYGSGGMLCEAPNPADQLNPAQGTYVRTSISRGCAPAEAAPFGQTPHRAQYVDPETGAVSSIIVVPCSQSLGWEDGYAPLGVNRLDELQAYNDPARPMLVMLAHDGDNAWGGGFSYYMEAVPNLASAANAAGYVHTVVERYLADHPVPADDVVHVEDGAWVNADNDFGGPQFHNWNEALRSASGQLDPLNGWSVDVRGWAMITAATDFAKTAEQILDDAGAPVRMNHVLAPGAASTGAERSWHFLLGSLNSGYMYYGDAIDMEAKPGVAANEAIAEATPIIGDGSDDRTGPTIWIPQRDTWNPGATNFGPQYGYTQTIDDGDFVVWTLVHDVSGLASVTLRYRVDDDGVNPLASTQNEVYADGSEVGSWVNVPMNVSPFPSTNVYGWSGIDFLEPAAAIASRATAEVTGLRDVLLDYYVESVDARGNVTRSPIQHVWVGDGAGSGGGGGGGVTVDPDPAIAGSDVTVTYDPSGGPLAGAAQVYVHYGFDGWNVVMPDLPMTAAGDGWSVTLSVAETASQLDLVFNDGAGTWDNNGGADWHIAVEGGEPGEGFEIDGVLDANAVEVASGGSRTLWAGLAGSDLYVATESANAGNDVFILVADTAGSLIGAPWAKSGFVAAWDAFLAQEHDGGWNGWFSAAQVTPPPGVLVESSGGAILEGTINLAQLLGDVPASVRVAVAPFATPDGGVLAWADQVPASVDGNGNVEAFEWIELDLCTLTESCCPTDVDGSGDVGFGDVLEVLAAWGSCAGCAADIDDDGTVGFEDLLAVLAAWGDCA